MFWSSISPPPPASLSNSLSGSLRPLFSYPTLPGLSNPATTSIYKRISTFVDLKNNKPLLLFVFEHPMYSASSTTVGCVLYARVSFDVSIHSFLSAFEIKSRVVG